MSETRWTPGPWEAYCRHVDYESGSWPEDEFLQWEVKGPREPYGRGDFYQADAQLVAAAPDLYEALEECKRVLSDLPSTNQEGTRTRNAWEKARAALAKARGE